MKDIGVYEIRCVSNGKSYVGSSTLSLARRWIAHKTLLRKGRHHNRHLQASWNKHGERLFEFIVLEECEAADCLEREQFWIDARNAADPKLVYNLRPKAANNAGMIWNEEQRRRLSRAQTGKKHSSEAIANMRVAARARGISPATRAKAREAIKGKPISEERKARQAAALRGRKHSPERIAKQAESLRGHKHNEEVCANMSAGQMGKKHSEATKAKMAATRKGRKRDEACRKAISEGQHRKNFAQGKRNVSRIVMPSGNVRYRAVLSVNRRKTNLGYFLTEQEANNAYDTAWLKQFGPLSPEDQPAKHEPSCPARKILVFSFMADDED